jgi:hypothetical protein
MKNAEELGRQSEAGRGAHEKREKRACDERRRGSGNKIRVGVVARATQGVNTVFSDSETTAMRVFRTASAKALPLS